MSGDNGYTVHRYNGIGLHFTLQPHGPGSTLIRYGHKHIVVQQPFDVINQAWYYWTMQNRFIQDAFSMLTADEREFIQTGITPNEWLETFGDPE